MSLHRRQSGLTLLEVLLALAILGGALVMLAELNRLGMQAKAQAEGLTMAQLLCESKLAEITAGIVPPEGTLQQPLTDIGEDEVGWLYSIEAQAAAEPGLLAVKVTVEQDPKTARRPVQFSLVRWVVDPNRESETASNEEASTSSSSSSSANNSSSGS